MDVYEGTFSSTMYGKLFCSVMIVITVPENFMKLEDCEARITLKYSGLYNKGKILDMTCKGKKNGNKYKFNGKNGTQIFSVTIDLLNEIDNGKIKCQYTSSNPDDYGDIEVERIE